MAAHRHVRSCWQSFSVMYYACRSDYPCEGCEQPRWMAAKNAYSCALRMERR